MVEKKANLLHFNKTFAASYVYEVRCNNNNNNDDLKDSTRNF